MNELSDKDKFDPDYLRRTYPRYRTKRYEDGIWYIQTRFKPPDFGSLTYDVYVYSSDKSLLAACVPPLTGTSLLKRFPDKLTLHQMGEDGKVLLFEEKHLHELANPLKLARKKQVSEEMRLKLQKMSLEHSPFRKKTFTEKHRAVSESHNLFKPISEPVSQIQTHLINRSEGPLYEAKGVSSVAPPSTFYSRLQRSGDGKTKV